MISILELLMPPLYDSYEKIRLHVIPRQRRDILEILKVKAFTETQANFLSPQHNQCKDNKLLSFCPTSPVLGWKLYLKELLGIKGNVTS